MVSDVIGRFDEQLPGERLLQPAMRNGRPVADVNLEESRPRFQSELQRLQDHLKKLEPSPTPYAVGFSERLRQDLDRIQRELV